MDEQILYSKHSKLLNRKFDLNQIVPPAKRLINSYVIFPQKNIFIFLFL